MSGAVRGLAVLAVVFLAVLAWWARPGVGDAVDDAVSRVLSAGPSGAVVVFDANDTPRDVRSYGSLIGTNAPETLRFRLASLTKPVTAAAVLKLVEQGKLGLDTPLSELLPDAAMGDRRAPAITVRDLLRHSSGIDETDIPPLFVSSARLSDELGLQADVQTDCSVIAAAMLARPLAFAPGTAYRYSNTGYCLLGLILQDVTGMSLEDAIHQLVGTTARLNFDLTTLDVDGAVVPDEEGWLVRRPKVVGAAGGLIGSAVDFLDFMASEVPGDVFAEPPYAFEDGHFYGLGWRVWPGHDCPERTHFGSMPGAFSVAVADAGGQRMVALFKGRPSEDWPPFIAMVAAACDVFEERG